MSKSILVIDTPNCCGECPMSGMGVCRKWNTKDLRGFSKDCPLRETPQKLVEENRWFSKGYADGYNSCIDEILKERNENEAD